MSYTATEKLSDDRLADLSIENLTVEYPSGEYTIRPIDDMSLEIGRGSLAILLGPSGCGKTTLLSCLGGILTPTSGSIRFGDLEITGLSGGALTDFRRHTVGIVFQGFNLVASLTAVENVMVPLRASGVGRADARKRAEELIDMVDLGHRAHHRPSDLSGGQQQRVAVARALALDPPLLLADEPTAHLDFIQVEEILKLIRRLATEGRVVVVSTHDHRMIPLADHVVQLVPNFMVDEKEPEKTELTDGQILFHQGDDPDLIYTIDSGEIEIVRELADGGQELRVTLGVGDYFGEMGPFFGLPRSATARAKGPTVITGYTPTKFRETVGSERVHQYLGAAGEAGATPAD